MLRILKKVEYLTSRLNQNLHSRFSQENKSASFQNEFHKKAYLASGFMNIIENPIHQIRKISLKNQLKDFLDGEKSISDDSKN